jgi:hypothetical protein
MTDSSIKQRRDQALACLVLASCIALAAFSSVFGDSDMRAIEQARKSLTVHENLRRDTVKALQENREALAAVETALDRLKRQQSR